MKKTILLVVALCAVCITNVQAQSWRWGVREGSSYSEGGGLEEGVNDMAVDKQGNIYVISNLYQTDLNIDGHAETGYGNSDAVLSSFTCNGTFRWAKVIGGSSDDQGFNVQTDTLGGVYITGYILANPDFGVTAAYVSTDTTIMDIFQTFYLAKFDTAGNYKWFTMPQSDSVFIASYDNTLNIDLNVSPNGDIYWMMLLAPGAYAANAFVVDSVSPCILKYSAAGTFQGVIRPDIQADRTSANDMRMQKNYNNGRYYIAGGLSSYGGYLGFGGTHITHAAFAGGFDSVGHSLWLKENVADGASFQNRPALDAMGNIYLVGYSAPGDTFNSFPIVNTLDVPVGATSFITKVDSNGNSPWLANASANSTNEGLAIVVNGSEVVIAVNNPGEVVWPDFADTINHPFDYGADVFITRFNKETGKVTGEDTINSNFGVNEIPSAMVADRKGNIYVGGQFQSEMYIGPDTIYSIGGDYDAFIAKYGYDNCSCTSIPTASYTYSPSFYSVAFTYTGTAGADSVVWNFGDGTTSTTISPTHTYAVADSYNVCVTVYTDCGNTTTCEELYLFPESVQTINGANIAVYPNPAKDELVVRGMLESGSYRILNAAGVNMQSGTLQQGYNKLPMQQLAAGMYILEITGNDGARNMVRIVKE